MTPIVKFGMIVACSEEGVIGVEKDGKLALPWYLPRDLARFKAFTDGHIVIMGRKTYESIVPSLKNRIQIVVTRDEKLLSAKREQNLMFVDSLEEAYASAIRITHSMKNPHDTQNPRLYPEYVWVIGGGEIYKEAIQDVDLIMLTRIQSPTSHQPIAYFPIDIFDTDPSWSLVRKNSIVSTHGMKADFETWRKAND